MGERKLSIGQLALLPATQQFFGLFLEILQVRFFR